MGRERTTFDTISGRCPTSPTSGPRALRHGDFDRSGRAGGHPGTAEAGLLHGDAITANGKTLAREQALSFGGRSDGEVVRRLPPSTLRGDRVLGVAGPRRRRVQGGGHGGHRVPGPGPGFFNSEQEASPPWPRGASSPAGRGHPYEGRRGPRHAEMLAVTGAISGGAWARTWPYHRWPLLRRHPRFSVGHVASRGRRRGADRAWSPTATRSPRRAAAASTSWCPTRSLPAGRAGRPRARYTRGALEKYARTVSSAPGGRDHALVARAGHASARPRSTSFHWAPHPARALPLVPPCAAHPGSSRRVVGWRRRLPCSGALR